MKKNNSYGVSTLRMKHVLVKGDDITIDFMSKKGVSNTYKVKDKTIKNLLRQKNYEK